MKTIRMFQEVRHPSTLIHPCSGVSLNIEDSSLLDQECFLTFSRIKDVLTSAVSMGATVVRSHTLGKYCQSRVLPCIRDKMDFMSIAL